MTTAFFRTVILYFTLMIGLRLMGKRQIGELEPSELVLTLLISDLAAVPMQDFGIPLIHGILPIVVLLSLSMLLSYFNLKSIRFRALLCGRPTLIIRNGKLLQRAMQKNRFTVDELHEQLRSQNVTDLEDVKYAILETSGKVSLLLYSQKTPLTAEWAGIPVHDTVTLPILLINDGHIMADNLRESGHDMRWLQKQLQKHSLSSPHQVFLFTVDENEKTVCIKKEDQV